MTGEDDRSSTQVKMTGEDDNIIKIHQNKALQYCNEPKTMTEIMEYLGLKSKTHVREKIIMPLIENNSLKRVEKSINSKFQKYVTSKTNEGEK